MESDIKNRANADIGMQIRLRRTEAKMSLAELSAKANIPASSLSLIEQGKANPTVGTIAAISEALGLELRLVNVIPVMTMEQFGEFTRQQREQGK